jgi:hypothetical protein
MISKRSCNCIKWILLAALAIVFSLILNWTLHNIYPDKEDPTESVQAVGE